MNNTYQDQSGALPLSGFASYFTNPSNSLWKGGIGSSVSNFVQATEDKLSQWFWQSISALPKEYFVAKDITNLNHFDKSLWEGMFNERVAHLKEQLKSELTEQQQIHFQNLGVNEHANIDKLKEQMVAGLPQGKLSLEEQLIHLQRLVGKDTLSPQDYEDGLDVLKEATSDNKHYTVLIEQVRSSFRSALKAQQGLLEECLQGDLLRLFKESPEQSFTPAPLKKILRYYKPLMKHKTYAKQKDWIEQCYNTQSLLPFPSARKHIKKSSPAGGLLSIEGKQDSPTWSSSIRDCVKFLWENSGKLVTLGLATQVAAVQASGTNGTGKDFLPEENSTGKFPLLHEMNGFNRTFLTDKPLLYLNNLSVFGDPSLALGNDALVDTGVTTEANTFDKVIAAPANVTANSGPDHGYHVKISEELRQEVLHQFDKVIADLEDLQGVFSNSGSSLAHRSNEDVLTRMVRSAIGSTAVGPPTTSSKKCKITEGRLRDLNNNIQKALNSVSYMSSSSPKCTFNEGNLNKCDEWVTNILCGVQRLKHAFKQADRTSTELQSAYDDLYKDYEKDIANVRSSVSEEFKGRINKLETDMQVLEEKNYELKQENEKERKEHRQTAIKLCASKIQQDHYQIAVDEFEKWNDNTMLKDIVSEAYKRNITNIPKVIAFANTLPWCEQYAIAFPVLYNQMESNGHLSSPQILSLSCVIRYCHDHANNYTGKKALQTLQSQLKKAIKTLIEKWGGEIHSGKYETIKSYARQSVMAANSINAYLPDIVDNTYNNSFSNFDNTLKFIDDLPWNLHLCTGYVALFKEMQSNKHLNSHQLLMLAYRVKKSMDSSYASQDSKYKLTTVKNSLPSSVRGLIWNGNSCTIRNREREEYLYASRVSYGDKWWGGNNGNKRYVFTWIPKEVDSDAYWEFKAHDNAKSFTIRNTDKNEYLYSSDIIAKDLEIYFAAPANLRRTDNDGRTYVFTDKKEKDPESYWELTPVNNGEFFTIRNTRWKERLYLYSDGRYYNEEKRRYVFTWLFGTPEGVMEPESQWKINC